MITLSQKYSLDITTENCVNRVNFSNIISDYTNPSETNTDKYLDPTELIDYTNFLVIDLAGKLIGDNINDEMETAKKVLKFTSSNIKYDKKLAGKIWNGDIDTQKASVTVQRLMGTCSEYANTFIAIMRLKKIPAKYITGKIFNASYHAWAEFYVKGCGWIPADPQMGSIGVTSRHIKLFESSDFKELHIKLKQINMSANIIKD